jgi:hypothetical protein
MIDRPDTKAESENDDQIGEELSPETAKASPRRQSLRDRANAPSDTVGTGSYAAVACSVVALLVTALLIGGLLLVRWVF